MTNENIFSGLKVVDLSSFIAGPSAAVILSDYGADVIKVEPPTGDPFRNVYRLPPQPRSHDNYPWHLDNRNKRGMTLDLKSPHAKEILERLVKWADVFIVNTPHPARKKLKLEYEDVAPWNPRLGYADLTGYGENGPDASLPGFDITAYWARTGLLSLTRDAGAPPTLPPSGSGDHATAVTLYSAIVTALTGASALERVRTSQHRSSARESGPVASTFRPRFATRRSSLCMTVRSHQTHSSTCIGPRMITGLCLSSRRTTGRLWRRQLAAPIWSQIRDSPNQPNKLRIRQTSPAFWTKPSTRNRCRIGKTSSSKLTLHSASCTRRPKSLKILSSRRTRLLFHLRAPEGR